MIDRNIFDAAAKKLRKQARDKQKPQGKEPSATPRKMPDLPDDQDTEAGKMMQKIRLMQQDLDNQLSELRIKGKLYNVDVDLYIDNLQKHYPQEMKKVTQAQKELMDAIDKVFTPETCIKPNPKSKEKLTKERNSKTLGFRKKWIPIE